MILWNTNMGCKKEEEKRWGREGTIERPVNRDAEEETVD
jgi:hypothetical protein